MVWPPENRDVGVPVAALEKSRSHRLGRTIFGRVAVPGVSRLFELFIEEFALHTF